MVANQINLGQQILVTYTVNRPLDSLGNYSKPPLTNVLDCMPHNTNVAIAAAVTAYSRMLINTYKLKH